jgi:ribosomal protein S17
MGEFQRRTKIWAHDEFELCSVGDMVRIKETRALSKRKAHVVDAILHKEDGTPPPDPFPSF